MSAPIASDYPSLYTLALSLSHPPPPRYAFHPITLFHRLLFHIPPFSLCLTVWYIPADRAKARGEPSHPSIQADLPPSDTLPPHPIHCWCRVESRARVSYWGSSDHIPQTSSSSSSNSSSNTRSAPTCRLADTAAARHDSLATTCAIVECHLREIRNVMPAACTN